MAGIFQNLPYTNFHELNLDWVIEKVRETMAAWEDYKTSMDEWKLGVDDELAEFQAWFDNLDVQDEVRTVINELIQSGEFIEITSPQIVSATEAWLAAHITPTTPAIDDTLSISGAAADAKVTGDRISDLKEDINDTNNALIYAADMFIPLDWEYGNIDASGNNANEDRHYYARTKDAITTLEPIDIYINTISATDVTHYIVVEYNKTTHELVSRTVYQTAQMPSKIVTTNTASEYRFCIMCNSSVTIDLANINNYQTYIVKTALQELKSEVEAINNNLDEGDLNPIDIVEKIDFTATIGSMTPTGYVYPSATDYGYTNKIPVNEGDVIRSVPYGVGNSVTMRCVTAFNGDTAVVASAAENVSFYTVPSGITHIVVTGYVGVANDPNTIPYLFKFRKGYADKHTDSNGFVVKRASVTNGDQINIPLNNVSKNEIIAIDATVTSFNTIEIGRSGINNKIQVTSSNIIFYDDNGTVTSTTPHGLTINHTISIRIVHDADDNINEVTVHVSSDGINAEPVTKGWTAYRRGYIFIKSINTALTDCTCSFAMKDINKATWIFGDSACSYTFNRWMGKLVSAGYAKNVLVNAYPGENASQNIPSLFNLINKGNPKAIVWVNGGNDGSDGTAPNAIWMNAVLVFITACESRGIIPILCTRATFPGSNPPSTFTNNELKNDWIRSSGYRYIDFAKAVGASATGVWYDGMLSSDGVHPTEKGAIALFNKAITDCPELMEE